MKRLFPHPWGWASLAPIACAIHCVAAPLAVAISPSLAPGKAAEWGLLLLTAALVAWAIPAGFRRHAEWVPMALVGVGLAIWVVSLMHVVHAVPEELTTVLGSMTVAGGLFMNARISCDAPGEACNACEAEDAETAAPQVAGASVSAVPSASTPAVGHAERHQAA
ncbi:MAG: MerC domain-containing protein [Gemmatimonadales bacterium]|nr:MAG: MerC domain-containing protein [Gemmatimonadales bacterium]